MKIDLDTMFAMSKYSDPQLGARIASLYAEADNKTDELQISHLAFMMQHAIDPSQIKSVGNGITKWTESVKMVENTGGDIKKLKEYAKLEEAISSSGLICEANKATKYFDKMSALYKILIDNGSTFAKGFKKNMSISKMVYVTLVIAWLQELQILSSATVAVQNVPNSNVDKYIEKTAGWKNIFDRTDELINDKDFKKLILSSADIELKAEAIQHYAESIAKFCNVYSEVSLQDVALLIKLGLAKVCYALFGLLRFLIFTILVSKYTLEDKIESIKSIMKYNSADLKTRARDEDKFLKDISDVRIDDIKSMSDANKEADNIEVKELKENEFQL